MSWATRGRTAVAFVLGAALIALGAAQVWATAPAEGVLGSEMVAVSGTLVAPVLTGIALVLAACVVVLLLAGPTLTRIVAAVALAATVLGAVQLVAADPVPALEGAAAAVVGVPELSGPAQRAAAGMVLTGLGLLVSAAAAVLALVRAPAWPAVGRRFERTDAATSREQGTARAAEATGLSASERAHGRRARALDDWAAIERGEDPTDGAP